MQTIRRLKALTVLVIGLGLGYALATQLDEFLGIEFLPKELPVEARPGPARPLTPPPPISPLAAIVLPPGGLEDNLYLGAAEALAGAIELRSSQRPRIIEPAAAPERGRVILVGTVNAPRGLAPSLATEESFAFVPTQTATAEPALAVVGGGRSGEAYGLYRLADRLLSGTDETDLFSSIQTFSPALSLRLVDLGAVGVPQDPQRWDSSNYSHHQRHFEDALIAGPPFVDEAEFSAAEQQFREYVQRMIAYGNNGIVVEAFLEFIDFDRVGSGQDIYPADSEYRDRHATLREHFGRLFQYAEDMGMQVILYSDMLALTPPLQAYLENRFGGLDTENPALWEVYRLGLEELFQSMPMVDGVMIRVGEAGSIYNLPGWDYSSALAVRSIEAVQLMLRALLQAAEQYDRLVIFRTWSVGVGQVGDMHTNPASYHGLLEAIDSPYLVVSTKYVMGDFYSYLPFNPTLAQGRHARLVEMQNRLEFEGFMAFPDYIGPLHQAALRGLRQANPRIIGAWMWNQGGGPQQAGPMSLYPFYGFWLNIDANSYATARLAWEPDADPRILAEEWVRRTFGNDPSAVEPLTEMLFLSREAVLKGMYIGPFARQHVRGLGLDLTPQMWLFEWDIVDGSNSALTAIYRAVGDDLEQAIAEGFEAVADVEQMQALIAAVDPERTSAPARLEKLRESLAYEHDLFETLAWYRTTFLRYYQWLDTGDREAFRAWQEADEQYRRHRLAHLARYGEDLDFPAFNFLSAEAGMAHARRAVPMMWLARALAVALVCLLALGSGPIARRLPTFAGKAGLQALWQAFAAPWDDTRSGPASRMDWLTALALPFTLIFMVYMTFSSFLSAQYLLLTALLLGGFLSSLFLLNPVGWRRLPWQAALPASLVAPTLLLAAVISVRGPGMLWFWLWADAARRTVFVVLNVTAIVWMMAVLYGAQRRALTRGRVAAAGRLVGACGVTLALLGAVPAVSGLERTLTAINDEMAVLPLGLSRILGITTHLDIPTDLPMYMLAAGAALALLGGALALAGDRLVPGHGRAPAATGA